MIEALREKRHPRLVTVTRRCYSPGTPVFAAVVIGTFILGVFIVEFVRMWWRQNAWRRHWRDRRGDDE